MSKIAALLLLLPITCFGQLCRHVLEEDIDQFTNDKSLETELYKIDNGYSLAWRMVLLRPGTKKQDLTMRFIASEGKLLRCTEKGASITLLTTDGKKINMRNSMQTDCSGYFSISFFLFGSTAVTHKAHVRALSKVRLKAMRVVMDDRLWDYEFTDDQAHDVQRAFECAMDNIQ